MDNICIGFKYRRSYALPCLNISKGQNTAWYKKEILTKAVVIIYINYTCYSLYIP